MVNLLYKVNVVIENLVVQFDGLMYYLILKNEHLVRNLDIQINTLSVHYYFLITDRTYIYHIYKTMELITK